jgi:hypothetical protein
MPSAPGREHEVLTVAAIYGANASGKSNLLDGLRFMARAIDQSFRVWRADQGVPRTPFRHSSQGRLRPSTFVVELVIDDVPYTYGFSVDDTVVTEEWLYSYPEKRKRILFEREGLEIKFGTTLGKMKTPLKGLGAAFIRPNALYLGLVGQLSPTPMRPVVQWLTERLHFQGSPSEIPPEEDLVQRVVPYLDDEGLRQRLIGLLVAADTGITNIYIQEVHEFVGPGPELRFMHRGAEESFGIGEESDGTRNWLALLPATLDVLDHGGTLVVDEIDSSLHPLLAVRLVQLFKNSKTNPKCAQLIFTAHDTTLMGSYAGHDVLERDNIWFVEKGTDGQSKLFPLTDFKPRVGENAEKRYLGGSYGAVPVLSDFAFEDSVSSRG